jgi:hypothetical protein
MSPETLRLKNLRRSRFKGEQGQLSEFRPGRHDHKMIKLKRYASPPKYDQGGGHRNDYRAIQNLPYGADKRDYLEGRPISSAPPPIQRQEIVSVCVPPLIITLCTYSHRRKRCSSAI